MSDSKDPDGRPFGDPQTVYDFDPRNLPPEFLEAVGLLIASAAQTESVMRDFIGALLGIDNIDTIALGAHMTIPLKDTVIRALAELKAPNARDVDKIDDLLDAIKTAFEKRNAVAHNSFLIDPKSKRILSLREQARGSLEVTMTPITTAEIRADALQVYQAGMDLMKYMISNDLGPRARTAPLRTPLDRRKKARKKRSIEYGKGR